MARSLVIQIALEYTSKPLFTGIRRYFSYTAPYYVIHYSVVLKILVLEHWAPL